MNYPDLSPYTYYHNIWGSTHINDANYLNIGWLDLGDTFPTGDVSNEFLESLFILCCKPLEITRGFHVCTICPNPNIALQPVVERNGKKCHLGNGEIRVRSGDNVYVAPTLIYHYVLEHKYFPPNSFIEAVLLTKK